jgi:RNA polymerase sigma factor (sigma-70 family)
MPEHIWTTQPTDRQLVSAIARGDMHALETLYERHGLAILAYLIGQVDDRHLAEEVLQDVMLAAWQGARRFRGDSSVRTWLLAIARRRAITARHQRAPLYAPLDDDIAADTGTPGDRLDAQADQAVLRAALAELPPDQRETLELVFYHDLSGSEAAEVLGVAPGTVKSRLHRAKSLLHALLRHQENADA